MRMHIVNRAFATSIAYAVLAALAITIAVKAYSVFSFPSSPITNWNYRQLGRIEGSNESTDDYSFAVFGDNKNSISTFNELIGRLNEDDVRFAIDVGDLVYDGENEKYRFFTKQIATINKPLLTVLGNHDIREGGRANYYRLFGPFYYSFTVGDDCFLVLDDADEKGLDPWQLDWLEERLKESQGYRNRFVFMHVPLFDPREGEYERGHSLKDVSSARRLNELFDAYHVTMLFTSHIHAYYRGRWGKTPYIITGGAGAELAGTDPKHYFYHYLRVNVSDAGADYQIIQLKSPDYELIDRWRHDAWIYVCAFVAVHFLDVMIILGLVYLSVYVVLRQNKWTLARRKG